MVNGVTTGGAGGPTVTVTNGTDFNTQINIAGPRIVQVSGPLSIGSVKTTANKTIVGLGTNAALLGDLNISGVSNVIVRNLHITNPGNDGITIRESGVLPGSHHVWVDHCTFYDTGDGACDISVGADYVTVSWCKFVYPTQLEHRFTMIADGPKDLGPLTAHITLHHNWWSSRADQRMAATSDALVHYYNNYFNCTNNSYCSNARNEAELNIENNYYSGVRDPVGVSSGTTGLIKTSGNIYAGCIGTIHPGTDSVFAPPYTYSLDGTANVPGVVMNGAGAPGADVVVFPPKIWDGGGPDNNLNTANNWGYAGGYNETPKEYDVICFAGNTRLTPNNNFTANNEYGALNFSNNAGPFVLAGNALNLGGGITNDSLAPQTINLNLDFTFAADHFSTNRYFDVSQPTGALVLNGGVAGFTSSYGRDYSVTKLGPGLLSLNGINIFPAVMNFNGGLVRFNTLATNLPGSLGTGAQLIFDGGGLQWASGNSADISARAVSIRSGGATFDVGANTVVFGNPIGAGGVGGITKTGAGRLTLNGNNTFSGITLVLAGTLALGPNGAVPNSAEIVLTNNAVLDVQARSDATLTLGANKKLRGVGTVLGNVLATSGATIAPGFSLGPMEVAGALTLQSGSTVVMELSAMTQTNDLIHGMSTVHFGGELQVTNLGGAFNPGDNFKLFDAAIYAGSFAILTLPELPLGLGWTNRLAVDGSLAVVALLNQAPAPVDVVAAGTQLILSWPSDHIGWRLEAQTNQGPGGLGSNWFPVVGSAETNVVTAPIDPTHGSVFYRLIYP